MLTVSFTGREKAKPQNTRSHSLSHTVHCCVCPLSVCTCWRRCGLEALSQREERRGVKVRRRGAMHFRLLLSAIADVARAPSNGRVRSTLCRDQSRRLSGGAAVSHLPLPQHQS